DAALDRPGIGAGRLAVGPADLFGADLAFDLARVAGVVLLAELQRIDAEFFGQLIDRLLQGEDGLRVPGRPERRRGAGVGEDVVVLGADGRAGVHVLRRTARSRAGADAAGAVIDQVNREQFPLFVRGDLVFLIGAGPIADAQVLF